MSREVLRESIAEILSEYEIVLDAKKQDELITDLINNFEVSHEMSGVFEQSRGYDNSKISELQRQLAKEQNKAVCHICKGHGTISENMIAHTSTSTCCICNGSGFIYQS